ncbi:MAG: DUF1553 domain-containing protein, partial [Bdellovibrionales bacterium]|nr:DUF1553 domain-containing protein [Bdellovibrionales bacterium]
LIMTSQLYSARAVPMSDRVVEDEKFEFAGPVMRPLTAEQVFDSFWELFEVAGDLTSGDLFRLALNSKVKPLRVHAERVAEPQVLEIPISGQYQHVWIDIQHELKRGKQGKVVSERPVARIELTGVRSVSGPRTERGAEKILASLVEYYPRGGGGYDGISEEGVIEVQERGLAHLRLVTQDAGKQSNEQLHLKLKIQRISAVREPLTVRVYEGAKIPAALREQSPVLSAFGRPSREQVLTRRDSSFSAPRVLALATEENWDALLEFAAHQLAEDPVLLERKLEVLLGRSVSPAERELFVGKSPEEISHLLWVLAASPEFLVVS